MESYSLSSSHQTDSAVDLSPEQWIDVVQTLHAAAHDARRQLGKSLRGKELSEAEFLLLWTCFRATAPVPQHEMAGQVGLSKSQTSGLVESLLRKRCLSSERSQEDRRRQLWQITPQGRERITNVLRQMAEDSTEWLTGLHANTLNTLVPRLVPVSPQSVIGRDSDERREAA